MIKDNIQTVLEGILDSYSPVVNSDDLPQTPFCIHETKISETLRDKSGIYGYEYDLGVMIVGDSETQIDPMVEMVIDTLEMTIDDDIDEIRFTTMSGLQYDQDSNKFHNQLNFKCTTNKL